MSRRIVGVVVGLFYGWLVSTESPEHQLPLATALIVLIVIESGRDR